MAKSAEDRMTAALKTISAADAVLYVTQPVKFDRWIGTYQRKIKEPATSFFRSLKSEKASYLNTVSEEEGTSQASEEVAKFHSAIETQLKSSIDLLMWNRSQHTIVHGIFGPNFKKLPVELQTKLVNQMQSSYADVYKTLITTVIDKIVEMDATKISRTDYILMLKTVGVFTSIRVYNHLSSVLNNLLI